MPKEYLREIEFNEKQTGGRMQNKVDYFKFCSFSSSQVIEKSLIS